MPVPKPERCELSGHDFYDHAPRATPDAAGRVTCPGCGKPVKLGIRGAGHRAFARRIPAHRKAETEAVAQKPGMRRVACFPG